MVGGLEVEDEGAGVGAGWVEREGEAVAAAAAAGKEEDDEGTLSEGVNTERATAVEVTSSTSSDS